MRTIHAGVLAFLLGTVAAGSAQAIELRTGFGGPEGYGALVMTPNDDGSSSALNLPFAPNFFGASHTEFFVNNNGNITFNGRLGAFTPQAFPIASQPMIAPYWADVDTRGAGAVYAAAPNADTVVVTWSNVGYFSGRTDKLNDFQLTLLNRPDTGAGNFDIEFRYNRLEWTTGSASGGVDGLGGTPAQAGFDAGNLTNFFALPGSRTADVLELANTSNVSGNTPGLWTMAIRNGQTSDGSSPEAPLLPTIVQDGAFVFDFDIQLNQRIFIDPVVAVGYDYAVTSGPNILTALFPALPGDTDGYEIFDVGGMLLGIAMPGVEFDFGPAGVAAFGLRDIEASLGLDPDDPTAFVTGLTFVEAGRVAMTQTPVTVDTGGVVPEPATLLLSGIALLGMAAVRRRVPGSGANAPAGL